jgi:hypothetical protein
MLVAMASWRLGAALLLFNAALSLLILAGAPAQPKLSDRAEYEYSGAHALQPFCPNTIYCYRMLVPVVLEQIPVAPDQRWRGYVWLSQTLTASITGFVMAPFGSPFIASILAQTSYALTFTAYDPYTPDPLVFLIASLFLYWWLRDRVAPVALLGAIGVFAKETVALLTTATALSGLIAAQRERRRRWLIPAVIAWTLLLGFHWYMDTFRGWGISKNPAASFATGSWLAVWWQMNPSLAHKALIVFSAFGFAWAFAIAGFRRAPLPIRQLALGTMLPIAALIYVQTPERALGNAFYVVVPLATVFLANIPPPVAWAATITNALLTARLGLSSESLPGTSILIVPAAAAAIWALLTYARGRDKIQIT